MLTPMQRRSILDLLIGRKLGTAEQRQVTLGDIAQAHRVSLSTVRRIEDPVRV